MPPTIEPLSAQLANGEGSMLAGDLGLVVIKALLENGTGYVVTGWIDRANPIDAAIADTQHSVLARAGVALRRMRSFDQVERVVCAPIGGIGGVGGRMHRGAVVWNGRSGMRPALERFAALQVPGSVVGFCFDPDVARSTSSIVFDPEPTAAGLVRAIDHAFAMSQATGRPSLVLIRERALAMRGTVRCRDNVSSLDAMALDAHVDTGLDIDTALDLVQPNSVIAHGGPLAVVCGAPVASAVQRSLAMVLQAAVAARPGVPSEIVAALASVSVLGATVPTQLSAADCAVVLDTAEHVLVIDDTATDLADRLDLPQHTTVMRTRVPYGRVVGDDVLRAVVDWLLESTGVVDACAAAQAALSDLVAAQVDPRDSLVKGRVPQRGAALHRGMSPQAAAGLVLAQDVIGVPTRMEEGYPSYLTERGVPLTVVTAEAFGACGAACGAPHARATGVFFVTGVPTSTVQAAAAAAAATIEVVDAARPRVIGRAIARACAGARSNAHVIVLGASVSVIAADREVGFDPELLRADQLACSAIPSGSANIAEQQGDDLLAGPTLVLHDPNAARGALRASAELAPAWYDVRARRIASAADAARWQYTRRLLRSLFKVEL